MRSLILALSALAAGIAWAKDTWRIEGELSEACSCSVPCSCNFGENPSPHGFCYAVFAIDIKDGWYKGVSLKGTRIAGITGEKGFAWYLDDRLTNQQEKALHAVCDAITAKFYKLNKIDDIAKAPPELAFNGYKKAHIDQTYGPAGTTLTIGGFGGYEASPIIGMDGKTPVTVGNNYSWNMKTGFKAKTKTLWAKDSTAGDWKFDGTNSNEGTIVWTDSTPIYFR